MKNINFQMPVLESPIQPAGDRRLLWSKKMLKKYGNYILRRTIAKYKGVFDHEEGEVMKACFLSIWRAVDPIYFFFSRLTLLGKDRKGILRVRLTKYKGHHVVLSDGTHIKKNDVLVKIHLHNIKLITELQSIENAVRKGIIIYQKVYQAMPMLLEYINNHKKREKIKGIIGITMLDKGVERLGFDVVIPVNPVYRCFKKLSHVPILFLTSKPVSLRHLPHSSYLFISTEKLQNIYQKKD